MKNTTSKLVLFIIVLGITSLACTIQKEIPEITPTSTPPNTPTLTCTPTEVSVNKVFIIVNVDVGLNIRDDSSEHGKSLGIITSGSEIELLGKELKNGWICVKWNEIVGYVNADYLDLPDSHIYIP
jgi:hypothetical protein